MPARRGNVVLSPLTSKVEKRRVTAISPRNFFDLNPSLKLPRDAAHLSWQQNLLGLQALEQRALKARGVSEFRREKSDVTPQAIDLSHGLCFPMRSSHEFRVFHSPRTDGSPRRSARERFQCKDPSRHRLLHGQVLANFRNSVEKFRLPTHISRDTKTLRLVPISRLKQRMVVSHSL